MKMVKHIGFYVHHRSYELWSPVIPHKREPARGVHSAPNSVDAAGAAALYRRVLRVEGIHTGVRATPPG